METTKSAYAKINLTLDITSALPDGFHSIFTCMQSVSLCDKVAVKTAAGGIRLRCSDSFVPCGEKNTAFSAAARFFSESGIKDGCDIYIEKNIPMSAGLAGGSADAAAVLRALSEIYPGALSEGQLYSAALAVGADVPFCFSGGTMLCLNKGEILSRLPEFNADILIVKPDADVSTAEAYRRFDYADCINHPDNPMFLYYASKGEYKNALDYSENIFESLAFFPEGEAVKRKMLDNGAYFAAMSGSGSAYFGLFDDSTAAESCAEAFIGKYKNIFICKTKKPY